MLDALAYMTERHERVLVLEDDCFPIEGSVDLFEKELQAVKDDPTVYSVYGHHFGTESAQDRDFTRFQGWGWAAHSHMVRALLPELRKLFMMNEDAYCHHVSASMTQDIVSRLGVTPGRDVLKVLKRFFSWDSATAFLTAQKRLLHRRTRKPAIVNTGIQKGVGHFRNDTPHLRRPPFNMITLPEVWDHYDTTTSPCDFSKSSYGLEALDLKILDCLGDEPPGFFVEIGAHDGVTQSNSAVLEARGWRGLLIEASPCSYAKCVRARPNATVVHAACLEKAAEGMFTTLTDVGLMSLTASASLDAPEREEWLTRGEGFAKRSRQEIEVPAATLSGILDRHDVAAVDILLLDVERSEVNVLKGMDFARHAPRMIVVEDAYDEAVSGYLAAQGYDREAILLERPFTRDCLYRRR